MNFLPLTVKQIFSSASPFVNSVESAVFRCVWVLINCAFVFWLKLAVSIGNAKFNDVMEVNLPNDAIKPLPKSDM